MQYPYEILFFVIFKVVLEKRSENGRNREWFLSLNKLNSFVSEVDTDASRKGVVVF